MPKKKGQGCTSMLRTHHNTISEFYFNAIRTDRPPPPAKKSAPPYVFNERCTKYAKPGNALCINENKIRSFRSLGKM
jgi:hypothetical protein